jgi:hypothetical protein
MEEVDDAKFSVVVNKSQQLLSFSCKNRKVLLSDKTRNVLPPSFRIMVGPQNSESIEKTENLVSKILLSKHSALHDGSNDKADEVHTSSYNKLFDSMNNLISISSELGKNLEACKEIHS